MALIALLFVFVIPRVSDSEYSDVWTEIRGIDTFDIIVLVVVALIQIASYAPVLVAVLPGLKYTQGFVVNQATTAVSNVVPLGGALGVGATYGILASWGFSLSAITLSILVTGFWNLFMKLGFPVVGLALVVFDGTASAGLLGATAVGLFVLIGAIAVFALILRSAALAAWIGRVCQRVASFFTRLVGKPPISGIDEALVEFRAETIDLIRKRWAWITLSSFVFNFLLYVVLLMAIRAFGVGNEQLSWIQIFAAFSFGRLLSTLAITPGGFGFVEAGMLGLLTVGFAGPTAPITAAVLVFRALTFFLPVPLGAISYGVWALNRRWRTGNAPDRPQGATT